MMHLPRNSELDELLYYLSEQTQACELNSEELQELFDQVCNLAIASGQFQAKLEKRCVRNHDYEIVLKETWQYCFQHLDEYQNQEYRGIDWIKQCFGECLQKKLVSLIEEAKSLNQDSEDKNLILGRIRLLVMISGKLRRQFPKINKDEYDLALHKAFDDCLHTHKNLIKYDSHKQRVATFINDRLRQEIRNIKRNRMNYPKAEIKTISNHLNEDNIVDYLAYSRANHGQTHQIYQELVDWVSKDCNYSLRSIQFPKKPEITAREMVLARLKFGKDMSEIAISLGLPADSGVDLSKWYHRRKIREILEEWGKANEYLNWNEKKQKYQLDIDENS